MTDVFNTREQRRAERKRVNFTVSVVNVITEREFGHLGDVSATGIMIMSRQAPRREAIYQLRMPLIGLGSRPRSIEFGVQERWHDRAPTSSQVWAGYRIIAIRDDDMTLLDAWLAALT